MTNIPAAGVQAPAAIDAEAGRAGTLRLLLVVWVVFLAFPWIAPSGYFVGLGVSFFTNLLLIAGLNLIMGYCGQISLCHAGFCGLGAYVSGVLSTKYGVPPLASVPVALVVTALSAYLVGLPALRLRGHYLAMATLGFNAILSVLFVELVGLTGGPNGLSGVPPITVGAFSFETGNRAFYLAWAVSLLVMWGIYNLTHSRIGRAMNSVAGSEIGAASLGVDIKRLKVAVFVISAAIAAMAGVLQVHFSQFASPETFNFFASVLMVVMVAVGGWGRYWGPLFGALVFTAAPELLLSFHDMELLLFGLSMIVVLIFFPGGIAGAFELLATRWRRRRALRAAIAAAPVPESLHG